MICLIHFKTDSCPQVFSSHTKKSLPYLCNPCTQALRLLWAREQPEKTNAYHQHETEASKRRGGKLTQ